MREEPNADNRPDADQTLGRQKVEQVSASFVAAVRPVAEQGAVWDEIASRHWTDGVPSGTGAMREVYEHRRLELGAAADALPYPEDRPVGVVALAGGRAICADIFDQPSTLRRYWVRLVRSYALEAADVAPAKPSHGSARRLLQRPLSAARAAFRSPGLGEDVRINGSGVVGAALVAEGVAVHVALFRRRAGDKGGALRSPGERARRFYDR